MVRGSILLEQPFPVTLVVLRHFQINHEGEFGKRCYNNHKSGAKINQTMNSFLNEILSKLFYLRAGVRVSQQSIFS